VADEQSQDTPDYLGSAVHRTGEACFDALEEGDIARFRSLFGPYFVGILSTVDRVKPQVIGWEPSSALTWFSEPIMDLFDISGYAYIFAELHDKPELWEICTRPWQVYLTGDDADLHLRLLAGISEHQQNLYSLTPRIGLRTRWQTRLGKDFARLPRQANSSANLYWEPPVDHQSAFIRRIAPRHELYSFINATDIFTIKYLMALPGAADLDFGIDNSKVHELEGTGDNE
jgi:hypothetical protein